MDFAGGIGTQTGRVARWILELRRFFQASPGLRINSSFHSTKAVQTCHRQTVKPATALLGKQYK